MRDPGRAFPPLALYASGVFGWLAQAQLQVSQSLLSVSEGVSVRIFGLAFAGGMLWMAWKTGRRAGLRRIRVSDRIGSVAAVFLVLLLAVTSVQVVLGGVGIPGVAILLRVCVVAFVALVLISRLAAAFEWLSRRRLLVRAGIVVSRRGFGVSSGIGVAAVNAAAYLAVVGLGRVTFTSVQADQAAAVLLVVLMLLGFILAAAWCVAGWLYVRRVDNRYEQYRADPSVSFPQER